MRTKLSGRLYCGDASDCHSITANEPDWFVVHACRQPCYCAKCGENPDPTQADYLAHQEGSHLYLNLIDPPIPLFHRQTFDSFLAFMRHAWSTGKRILVHDNKGDSRAPSLCLLFLAKCARQLPNASYDEAWDAFEQLAGEPYTPGAGLEAWLREHWNEFPQDVEFVRPAEPRVRKKVTSGTLAQLRQFFSSLTPEEVKAYIETHPLAHFAVFAQIEGKSHKWFTPNPNTLQRDITEAYEWCIEHNIPPRLIVLKPRQVGCSTYCAELCYHHLRRFPGDMLMMADVGKRTEKLWEIFQAIPVHDGFPWDSKVTKSDTEKIRIAYPDGGEAEIKKDTAEDKKAGISGTRQIIWFSEAGRYKKNDGHDAKLIQAAMGSMPSVTDNPHTLAIMESTAEGSSGVYYDTWQQAVDLETRQAGTIGNGWIRVFAAWFEFPDHVLARTENNAKHFSEELDDRERRGLALYRWTPEQIAWRRAKIASDCAGDPKLFDQDFPEDPVSAFLSSGRPRFNLDGLTVLEKRARDEADRKTAQTGTLERNGEQVVFNRAADDPWLWVSEEPKFGLSYIGGVDPCTGEQNEGSRYPDAHAAGIIRAGYFDEYKVWHNARLVATIDVPTGCRWDDEVLGERMKRVLDWYGNPIVVVETGNGLGAISALRRAGCVLYEREKMDAMYPGKRLKLAGFETNLKTRPLVVNEIANYIREQMLDCTYLPAVEEMKTFITTDRGRAEAKSGAHDDWVMFLGMTLLNIELAQVLTPPSFVSSYSSSLVPHGPAGGIPTGALS